MELHFIELPKLHELIPASKLEQWMVYLKYEGNPDKKVKDQMADIIDHNPDINDAHNRYSEFVSDEELRDRYEARHKAQLDYKQGMETGLEQGIDQGKKETALKMLEEGMDIKLIAKITGLPEEEIMTLDISKDIKA